MGACDYCNEIAVDTVVIDGLNTDVCDDHKHEHRCNSCFGEGVIPVRVNIKGRVDYIDGVPNGKYADCDRCKGSGYTD